MSGDTARGTLRYYAALTPIVASAVGQMAAYRVVDRWSGASLTRASRWFRAWCRATCARLRVEVQVLGAPPAGVCVYLSNHRSYLDILLLGGLLEASFLSRADIGTWPVIGTAARRLGTLFLERDDPRSGARAARALARCVRTRSVVVFPEGTTGGERLPRPFADGLFRLLERLDAPVVPVTVRYSDRRAYWVDDLDIGTHLRTRILDGPPLSATIHLGPPLRSSAFADADDYAAAAYRAVCDPIERFGELTVPVS